MPVKFAARLPSTTLPSRMYYYAMHEGSPDTVRVSTDSDAVGVKIRALRHGERPKDVESKAYDEALYLGMHNIPNIRMIKRDGVHQQTLYTAPVYANHLDRPVGVLIGVDVTLPESNLASPALSLSSSEMTPSPEDMEREMMEEMIRGNLAAR